MSRRQRQPKTNPGASGVVAAMLLAAALAGRIPTAAEPLSAADHDQRPDASRWSLLGSFSGASRSRFLQQASELLFEIEANGELYQDLGAYSLGASLDLDDDVSADWDNSFLRRVYPLHEELPAGTTLEPHHVSRYLDVQGLITRGTLRWDYIPDLFTGDSVAAELQGGMAYYLARARSPLTLGDRPLAEALEDRDADDFHALSPPTPKDRDPSLLHLTTDGVAGLARWLSGRIGRGADTERGRLFFDDYPDSVTLFADLGVPVSSDLFLEEDPRLSVGDRIRVVRFLGLSPIAVRLRHFGFETAARTALRMLRITSLVKQTGNQALVEVREVLTNGIEVIPLKLRPRLRLFGVARIGYTLLEDRHGLGQASSSSSLFRLDLDEPGGLAALRQALGEGGRPSLAELELLTDTAGVERLNGESRRGSGRIDVQRLRLFSPFRYDSRTVIGSAVVTRDDRTFRQHTFARSRRLKKTIGTDRNWNEHYVIEVRGAVASSTDDGGARGSAAEELSILTGRTDRLASGEHLRCVADTLAELAGEHPVLEEIADTPDDEILRFFLSIDVHFEPEHLELLLAANETALWRELAALLLGPDHRDAWETRTRRSAWRDRRFRDHFAALHRLETGLLPRLTGEPLDLKQRLKLARRTVDRFARLQRLVQTGRCRTCTQRSFRRWEDTTLLQLLLFRLLSTGAAEPPGLRYEVFTDRLSRPVVVSNEPADWQDAAHQAPLAVGYAEPSTIAQRAQDTVSLHHFGQVEAMSLLAGAEDRLRSGELYLDVAGGAPVDGSCFLLRVYSDLRFDPQLLLRVELRRSSALRQDTTLEVHLLPVGEPRELAVPTFSSARFYHELTLPTSVVFEPEVRYALLLRLLNPQGMPVSEEQQVRFEWPAGGLASTPPLCGRPPPTQVAGEAVSASQ